MTEEEQHATVAATLAATNAAIKAAELASKLADAQSLAAVSSAVIATNIENIKADLIDIKKRLETSFVTQDSFDGFRAQMEPVRKGFYSLVTAICLAALAAIAKVIFIK